MYSLHAVRYSGIYHAFFWVRDSYAELMVLARALREKGFMWQVRRTSDRQSLSHSAGWFGRERDAE